MCTYNYFYTNILKNKIHRLKTYQQITCKVKCKIHGTTEQLIITAREKEWGNLFLY